MEMVNKAHTYFISEIEKASQQAIKGGYILFVNFTQGMDTIHTLKTDLQGNRG